MAEVTATERTRAQGCRLRKLRERLSIPKGRLMDALAFGSTQTYDLYERGVSVIRMDRLDDWAAAFGVSPLDFAAVVLGQRELDAVFPPATADATWDIRAELRAGGIPEDAIEGIVARSAAESVTNQRADVAEAIEHYRRSQARLASARNRTA